MYTISIKHRETKEERFYKSGISFADLDKEISNAENIEPNWVWRAIIEKDSDYLNPPESFEDDMDLQDIEDGEDEYYAYCD